MVITPKPEELSDFQVFSQDEASGEKWKLHCQGKIRPMQKDSGMPEIQNLEEIRARCRLDLPVDDYYQQATSLGAEYGPDFQGVAELWRGEAEAFGRLALPKNLEQEANLFQLHPVLLDSSFQIIGAALPRGGTGTEDAAVYVPVGLESYRVYRTGQAQMWAQARLRSQTGSAIEEAFIADLILLDDNGQTIAQVVGLEMRKVSRAALWKATQKQLDDWLYRLEWRADRLETASQQEKTAGLWLILADDLGTGDRLAEQLRDLGDECIVARAGEKFQPGEAGKWVLNPASIDDFQQLLTPGAELLRETIPGNDPLVGLKFFTLADAYLLSAGAEKDQRKPTPPRPDACSLVGKPNSLAKQPSPLAGYLRGTRGRV